jgi:DNA repair exonuclease SbcCD ATPase subunit
VRLKSISVEGFRGFVGRVSIDLSADVILLFGPNGAGKTSLLDAILWALSGEMERFPSEKSAISVYSREGVARVELCLSSNDSEISIVRASDGEKNTMLVRKMDQEYTGDGGKRILSELLMPRMVGQSPDLPSLSTMLTRGVYLQQDLVRQFIGSDLPVERFRLLSNVIGTGAIVELQETLERSRLKWSSSISLARRETVEPLSSRLQQVTEQLARLSTSGRHGSIDARSEAERLFRKASELIPQIGNDPSSQPPASSNDLDRFLEKISNERARLDRMIVTTVSLSDELKTLQETPVLSQRDIGEIMSGRNELVQTLEQNQALLSVLRDDLDLARRRQLEESSRIQRMATLASLALDGLGKFCPVCQQVHDLENTEAHLRMLIEAAGAKDAQGSAERFSSKLPRST